MSPLARSAALACAASISAAAPSTSIAQAAASVVDSAAAVPARPAVDFRLAAAAAPPRAVDYSEWYGRRLTAHRWASYTMLPLFAAQYVLGDRILAQKADAYAGIGGGVDRGTRRRHQLVAGGVGALFTLNTVTGVWNAVAARRDPNGRALRTTHTALMLAADAGFVATGLLASRARDQGPPEARTHRNVALGSMGLATAGAALMWFRRDD